MNNSNDQDEEANSGHPSFVVGMEDSQDRLNELQFSLVHHSAAMKSPSPEGR